MAIVCIYILKLKLSSFKIYSNIYDIFKSGI